MNGKLPKTEVTNFIQMDGAFFDPGNIRKCNLCAHLESPTLPYVELSETV